MIITMGFEYNFKNNEANFGPPTPKQIDGGTHIAFEIILKKDNKFIALRRQSIPGHEPPPNIKEYPKGLLFFCHDLIKYGEFIEDCVKRIVREQAGIDVKSFRVVYIDSFVQDKDNTWAFIPHVIVGVTEIPKIGTHGNEITEVVLFDKNNPPNDFAWWSKEDLKEFFEEYD